MKVALLTILCIGLFAINVYAELSQSDLDKIRLIVKDEIETAIHASEKRMKSYVDLKVQTLDNKLTGEINRLDEKINGLDKSINRNFQLILALIGFVTVVVGIPQIIVVLQNKKYKSISEDIETIKKTLLNN